MAFSSIALNGDACGDHVTHFEKNLVATGIEVFMVTGMAVSSEHLENFSGEVCMVLGNVQEVVHGSEITEGWNGSVLKGEIKKELEFPSEGGNRAKDVGAVDGAAVPGAGSTLGSFDEDVKWLNFAIISSNGD